MEERDTVKIAQIECLFLYYAFDNPLGNSTTYFNGKNGNVLKIVTDEGIVGYGESYGDSQDLYQAFKQLIPSLIGVSLHTWEPIQDEINKSFNRSISPFLQSSVESAFNLAFWDIQGKASHQSVTQLFGGECKQQVPVYGTGFFYRDVSSYQDQLPYFVKEMERYVDLGFQGIKMKAGRYSVEQDVWLIDAVRKELPDEVNLMVDVNCGIRSLEDTMKFMSSIKDLGISWIEEPFQPDEYEHYGAITRETSIPIAAGENEYTVDGFERIVQSGISVLQPELSLCGGFSNAVPLIELAKKSGISITPHVWGTGFLNAAALQFYSLIDQAPTVPFEHSYLDDPLRDECFDHFSIKNGFIDMPAGPGLGVEIDEDVMNRYVLYKLKC
jgi:D-galactarolactone cycloisomerase